MELPHNEAERLAAMVNYGVLDTDFEVTFDRITRLAATVFKAPICLISLIDKHRQWFKSAVGLDVRETPRDVAFCAHAILGTDVLVVPNATEDDRFSCNPLVTDGIKIRFYAGAPLITPQGFALGTICIIDSKPRPALTPLENQTMKDFAGIVIDLLEARKEARTRK